MSKRVVGGPRAVRERPLPGTDRRLTAALIVLTLDGLAASNAVRITGSWWWFAPAAVIAVVALLLVTLLEAREAGSSFADELRRVLSARARN